MNKKPEDIEQLLLQVLEKTTHKDRDACIDQICKNDDQLKAELLSLLNSYQQSGDFLENPPLGQSSTFGGENIPEGSGTIIGRYKLLEKIGEGGMATVYMAEQNHPICRRVALKIIKLGMDTKQVIARFEIERQALAMMDHPNIATVLDAGTTDTGRPYFVMELVRGLTIIEFCDKNTKSLPERLELFISVCRAVQHAHQRGIIHRDIKPSNVLVTIHDSNPLAKVIDFGIAKALNQQLTDKTVFTRYSQMIGTPEYMSPEQAEMNGLDIDTRTDVFSLGVLLYELVTGCTPYDSEYLLSKGYGEMQRIIREEEPIRPSTKINTLGESLKEVAKCRKAAPEAIKKLIRGDLDWIIMKALEKDRTQRYETVHALAEDVERHLRNEPIVASSPGTIYLIKKYLRRNHTKVITWACSFAIIICIVLFSSMYLRFRTERIRNDHIREMTIVEDMVTSGDYQRAIDQVEPILSSKVVGSEAKLLYARILLELQKPDESINQLYELLNKQPEIAANAHFLLAKICLEASVNEPHMKEKAEVHMQQGEQLIPQTPEAYVLRAIIAQTVKGTLGWLNDALQLNPSHYSARRTRALTYYALDQFHDMETDASVMIGSQPKNPVGYSVRAIARREMALNDNNSEPLYMKAVKDHNQAINLTSENDKRLAEYLSQRYKTLILLGEYDKALVDNQHCLELKPNEPTYHFDKFCILLTLGLYDEAQIEYTDILDSGLMNKIRLESLSAKYVFNCLWSGKSWYNQDVRPIGKAFDNMHEAARQFTQLASKAKRVVAEGFHPSFSPDGSQIVYSKGVLGASGIEILNFNTNSTRLLTVPGKDPAWSPDGQYILYVRDRQFLSMNDLTLPSEGSHQSWIQEEVWIIKADGTEPPRFLARGGWPNWASNSKQLYYHSRLDNTVYSMSVDFDNANQEEVFRCKSLFPAVSPDGKYIAYIEEKAGNLEIVDLTNKSVIASWTILANKKLAFICWSADGKKLAIGCYWYGGLWIYDIDKNSGTKIFDGSFAWCSWSGPNMNHMAIERVFGSWHHEVWIGDFNTDGNLSDIEVRSNMQNQQ